MCSFNSLKVGDYFSFEGMKHQIRRKVSIKKYIWISDGYTKYCENIQDEDTTTCWKTTRRHLDKCVLVTFNY